MAFEKFDDQGQGIQTSSTVLIDTALAKTIIDWIEPERIFRPLCYDYAMQGLAQTLPVKKSSGMGIEVAEGSGIPRVRTKMSTIPIALHKNATHFFMTVESELQDFNGDLYDRESQESGERMGRKENYDIGTVFTGAPMESLAAGTAGMLKTSDISKGKAILKKKSFRATDILINPDQTSDIESDTIQVAIDYTSEAAKFNGMTGTKIMGLNMVEGADIPSGTAIIIDRSKAPVWFCYNGSTTTEPYTEAGVGRGAVVTAFQNPVAMRPDAMLKITGC